MAKLVLNGQKLKDLRRQKGATLADVGNAIGASRSGVCQYENNRNGAPFHRVKALADYFGVNVLDLYHDPHSSPNSPL